MKMKMSIMNNMISTQVTLGGQVYIPWNNFQQFYLQSSLLGVTSLCFCILPFAECLHLSAIIPCCYADVVGGIRQKKKKKATVIRIKLNKIRSIFCSRKKKKGSKSHSQDAGVIILQSKHINCHSASGQLTVVLRTPPHIFTYIHMHTHTHPNTPGIIFILRGCKVKRWRGYPRLRACRSLRSACVCCCIDTLALRHHQLLYIRASVLPSWTCEVGILLSCSWWRCPHNSPPAQASGAAVLSESTVASRGLQTRFTFKLSLMWKLLPGATARFLSRSLG